VSVAYYTIVAVARHSQYNIIGYTGIINNGQEHNNDCYYYEISNRINLLTTSLGTSLIISDNIGVYKVRVLSKNV